MSTFKPFVFLIAIFLSATSAFALGPGDRHKHRRGLGHDNHQGNGYGHHKGGSHDVPELDPNAAGAAMILLIGGTLVLLERRR